MKKATLPLLLLLLSFNIMPEAYTSPFCKSGTLTGIYTRENKKIPMEDVTLSALYLGIGIKVDRNSYYLRPGFSGTFLLNTHWGGTINGKMAAFSSRNLPKDFEPGYTLFFSNGTPNDRISMISFCALREFTTPTKLIRFGIEAGPSIVSFRIAEFERDTINKPTFLSSPDNYITTYKETETLGLAIRAKFELPLTRFAGVEFAANCNLNAIQHFFSAEVQFNIGLVRDRLKKRK